ncbi:unnamed protein product [Mytilus coruscus]|uniref:Uncharacterized protein n=1 Tax=Mytilus coruscus TaxID=42192 RepID=A0A6J8EL16_MYTCO|nr:unnamed protein product [Mytilus coruscus]
MDKSKLAHAVIFFTDPSFIQLVACGTRELNLDNGEKLVIPDIVKTTMHSTLVELYLSHCDETDSQPLSRSSLFRIFNACSASKRSCLKGLDNISAEGSAAFDTCIYIISEIEKMGLLSAWSKAISSKLKSYKMYLKTDFKLHLEIESRCADHCLQWALSDTTDKSGNFKVHCLHKHDISCDRCSLLENFKLEMQNAFRQQPPIEQLKDLQYDFETAIEKIDEWKKHILRTVN